MKANISGIKSCIVIVKLDFPKVRVFCQDSLYQKEQPYQNLIFTTYLTWKINSKKRKANRIKKWIWTWNDLNMKRSKTFLRPQNVEFFFLPLLCVHPGPVALSILISTIVIILFSKDKHYTNSSQCCFGHFFVCSNGFVGTPRAPGHLEEAQSFPFPSQKYALSISQLVSYLTYCL